MHDVDFREKVRYFSGMEFDREKDQCTQLNQGNGYQETAALARCIRTAQTQSHQIGVDKAASDFIKNELPLELKNAALKGDLEFTVLSEFGQRGAPSPESQVLFSKLQATGYNPHRSRGPAEWSWPAPEDENIKDIPSFRIMIRL